MLKPACQLYTLREFNKTPSDIARTLKRVKGIGYDAVQCSALGPIDPKELARILTNEGLTCCATHTSLERLRDDRQRVIEEHALWGCRYTALGGFGWRDMSGPLWAAFVREMSLFAESYARSGLLVGYHNHSHEMIRYDGRTALAIIRDDSDPNLWLEIDTYWITHGGGDPAAWIASCAGRIPCVHLKDMRMAPDGRQRMVEVGEGNLNWPAILAAARGAGTEWVIIEQDDCDGADPFECLATSLRNLRKFMS